MKERGGGREGERGVGGKKEGEGGWKREGERERGVEERG